MLRLDRQHGSQTGQGVVRPTIYSAQSQERILAIEQGAPAKINRGRQNNERCAGFAWKFLGR